MREEMADVKRQAEAAPRAEDFAREAGATVQYAGDGSWTATVKGDANIRRAVDMQRGSRAVMVERGAKLDASVEKETLVDGDGRSMRAPVYLAESIARKQGLKPKRHYGRPSERWVVRGGEMVRVL